MVSTGTAEVVEIVLGQPVMNDTIFKANLSCYCHVLPEQYLIMTLNHSGGLLLRWFRDTFCLEEVREAKQKQSDAYDLILGDPKDARLAGPGSLLLLPHFAGSGTPTFDTASRGALIGMSFSTTKRDVAHAIIEGLTYELNGNLELLQSGGVSIEELRAIGGGARSDLWLQLKADVTGIPVLRPAVTEAACWGAALLAAQGAGLFADAARAAETSVTFTDRFQPNSDRTIAFKERFQLYQQLYPLLKQIHARL
jgi:xylulokinase